MSALDFLLPWDSQPQEDVGVDWGNPLSSELVAASIAGGTPGDPTVYTNTNGFTPGVASVGRVANVAAASTQNFEYSGPNIVVDAPFTVVTLASFATLSAQALFTVYAAAYHELYLTGATGVLSMLTQSGGTGAAGSAAGAVVAGEWAVFGGRVDGPASRSVWKNGVMLASNATSRSATTATSNRWGVWSGSTERFNGAYAVRLLWKRALTDGEMLEIGRNPWSVFAPRSIWVPVSAGGGAATDLTIQEAAHAHGADNLTLTLDTFLAVQDAAHAHAADNLTLSTGGAVSLTIADATHAHATDGPTVTVGYVDLLIADALHGHAADSLTLSISGATSLTIADATHGHNADAPTVSLGYIDLTVSDCLHAHTADSLTLSVVEYTALVIAKAMHGHLADNVTLSDSAAQVLGSLAGSRPLDPATRSNRQTATRSNRQTATR